MASSGEEPPAATVVANAAPPLPSIEAKMIVATGRDHCQQLKDMVSKEDPSTMVVVMASSHQTSTPPKPPSPPPLMDPGLLAVACTGSWKELQSFLNGDPRQTSMDRRSGVPTRYQNTAQDTATDPPHGIIGCCRFMVQSFLRGYRPARAAQAARSDIQFQQPSRDEEAILRVSFLDGVTIEGDTFVHVMATNSIGDDLIEDGIDLIHRKAIQFLSVQNSNGDTPLHCAARAAKSEMVSFLLDLARRNDTVKALLETENKSKWTVLHEAIRAGNNHMVEFLMEKDPDLARFPDNKDKLLRTEDPELAISPEDGLSKDTTSPLYLAILLSRKTIAETLYEKSGRVLSYSGPNGQNALHAAVLRGKDLTNMLLGWNTALTIQKDKNGSTPLHVAVSVLKEQRELRTIYCLLLQANPDALYQPDNDGLFPTHVAASIDATLCISDFLKKSPRCAGLRDARGRTFLHIAVDKRKLRTARSTCKNQSLSWILNMQDSDGNTALHLAVQKRSLTMFCALFGNRKVKLNITNEKGETPLDVARRVIHKGGLNTTQDSKTMIFSALKIARARWGIYRQDNFEKNDIAQARQDDDIRDMGKLKDSTQNLCIGSVLVATITFGATFAMPGGYRADDHTNGGTPTLAGRFAFHAFIMANTLAFAFSAIATIGVMAAGSPLYNRRSRVIHLGAAFSFMEISITILVAAFALGTYTMLAPVAHKTSVAVCVLSSLVLIYLNFEVAVKTAMVVPLVLRRQGIYHSKFLIFPLSALYFVYSILLNLWPIGVMFGLTAITYTGRKVDLEAQPPIPLA